MPTLSPPVAASRLFACVHRSKELPFGGDLSDKVISELGEMVAAAIDEASRIGEVSWAECGREGWAANYSRLSAAHPGLFGALTARAEAQVIRLAMIYALWDGSSVMTIDHLQAAQAVWNYCEASVRYIFGDSLGSLVADTILAALKSAGPDGLTRTDISGLFSRNESSGHITLALEELLKLGLATKRRGATNGAGRPSEIWAYK